MSTNIFRRLKDLLPASPVLVGKVLEHHDDDTSTVELPINAASTPYAAGLYTGSNIRARGTFVPVGEYAFVRDGVIETRAPGGVPLDIEIGEIVDPADDAIRFEGPIGGYMATPEVFFSLDLSTYFVGAYRPFSYELLGTIPAGLSFNSSTGVLSGTSTLYFTARQFQVRATDSVGNSAISNLFDFVSGSDGFLDTFTGTGRLYDHVSDSGHPWNAPGASGSLEVMRLDGFGALYGEADTFSVDCVSEFALESADDYTLEMTFQLRTRATPPLAVLEQIAFVPGQVSAGAEFYWSDDGEAYVQLLAPVASPPAPEARRVAYVPGPHVLRVEYGATTVGVYWDDSLIFSGSRNRTVNGNLALLMFSNTGDGSGTYARLSEISLVITN